jgi:hypothetical protein
MKIYTLLRKGEMHPVFCEDFLVNLDIDRYFYVGAVLDGCSSATDSHFASALLGKILKKTAQILPYQAFYQAQVESLAPAELGKWILKNVFMELQIARNQLLMDKLEMLATMVLLVYHKPQQQAWVIALGDGLVKLNQEMLEIDQNNRPDYLAYHLGEDFEEWFEKQENSYQIQAPKDLSISSDGILTFQTLKTELPEGFNPVDYLLKDDFLAQHPNMLTRKFIILQKQYGFAPADDVSIIRIKFD